MIRQRVWLATAVLFVGTVTPANAGTDSCDWAQWGQNPAHTSQSCARPQHDLRMLARVVVDPLAAQEILEGGGGLQVHYPVPLVDGDGNVFALKKGGSYVNCDPPGSGQPAPCGLDPENLNRMTWSVQALRWRHDQLVPQWTFELDWKPTQLGFEALVQPAMTDTSVYVPGAGGTVYQLAKRDGHVVRRIDPFDTVDPTAFVAGGLTIDSHGTLFYNVIKGARSWLVRATRTSTSTVDYGTLIPDAPKPDDLCYRTFQGTPTERPFPPPPQPDGSPALPPLVPCGVQRAAGNAAPAVGPDGTVVVVTRASGINLENYSYVVALKPDLTLKWAASLRDRFVDGCGIRTPYGNGVFDCRPGTARGVDPYSNMPPAGQVTDGSTSSPVILPDGGVAYGSRSLYNGFRGHLLKFDRNGTYQGNYDFGSDITPGVYRHDGTYSLVLKDNWYLSNGPFDMTRLDASLHREWGFTDTETRTCERRPDGTISCVDDGEHPNGFEWCISSPAIDRAGNTYGISEDGNLYVVDKQGNQRDKVFLSKTTAAAYTPVSLDAQGRVYAQNNGELYVLGH